jgi:hypothetical protein
MGLGPGVGIEPCMIGLEGSPIDKVGVVLGDENWPLLEGKMTHPLLNGAVFIHVAFTPALAVGVSASIHRIGQDVVDGGVGRGDPADLATGSILQGERQLFGAKPEPDPPRRAELREALETVRIAPVTASSG